jgi:hypothetical protein
MPHNKDGDHADNNGPQSSASQEGAETGAKKTGPTTAGETTTNPRAAAPPAFVRHRTESGEAVSHGLGMTNAGLGIFWSSLNSPKSQTMGSLVRAIERSRIKNLCFDWSQRHEISSFLDTVASLHRDEESTIKVLNDLYTNQTLPPSARIPDPDAVVDVTHFVPYDDYEVPLSKLEEAVSPWIARGVRRVGLLLGQFHEYKIIVNEDPTSWTIMVKNGAPLSVPGASYTILHGSEVLGVSPTSSVIDTSNCAFPFFEHVVQDYMYEIKLALEEVAHSRKRIRVNHLPCARSEGITEETCSFLEPTE